MKREYNVVIERDAAGYLTASVPDLPGCHTQAKDMESLQQRIREVIFLCTTNMNHFADEMDDEILIKELSKA